MNLQALTQEDLLRIPLKRKWWILASVVVCMTLAYLASIYSPKTFKSTLVVTIDSPRIAKEYVKGSSHEGTHDDPLVAMIQQINLELTNRSIFIPILDNLKPYPDDKTEGEPSEGLIKRLRKSIVVERAKEGVGVAISYVNSDPFMAQAVLALLAVKLQEENLKRREGQMETTTEFLSAELNRVKEELDVKERAISDFKRAHMGELPQLMDANLRTLDRLQIDLTNSSRALSMLGERLTALEKSIKEFSDRGPTGIVTVDRDRRTGDTRLIDSEATRLQELKQTLNELLVTYKENYPDVVQARKEILRLESALRVDKSQPNIDGRAAENVDDSGGETARRLTDPYLRTMTRERSDVKSEIAFEREKQARITQQIKDIEAHIEHTPAREQGLAMLYRDYENLQSNYRALVQKQTSAKMLENYESRQFGEQYRLIESANLPQTPQPPTQGHFLLGGLALGCLIGFGLAIGIEIIQTGFRRPEDVEGYLGLPVIASIPAFASVKNGRAMLQARASLIGPEMPADAPEDALSYFESGKWGVRWRPGKREILNSSRSVPKEFNLIAKWGPASLMAEQYRVAATRLILMTAERKNVMTLVTSSVMGEGKTTTAINLAYILAHDLSKSTLLIDCDFKRPMVHEYMGVPAGPGLSDVLQGGEILENCIHQCDGVPLSILPSGSSGVRLGGLLGVQYVRKILPELRTRYDHVILDGPPVMPLADTNMLRDMVDMTVFVVRAGSTSQDKVQKALKALGEHCDACGIILTQVEIEYAPYYTYAAAYANEHSES